VIIATVKTVSIVPLAETLPWDLAILCISTGALLILRWLRRKSRILNKLLEWSGIARVIAAGNRIYHWRWVVLTGIVMGILSYPMTIWMNDYVATGIAAFEVVLYPMFGLLLGAYICWWLLHWVRLGFYGLWFGAFFGYSACLLIPHWV
jgi:hypothetical protein